MLFNFGTIALLPISESKKCNVKNSHPPYFAKVHPVENSECTLATPMHRSHSCVSDCVLTLPMSSFSNTGFLGRVGGEGIRVLSKGSFRSTVTRPGEQDVTWSAGRQKSYIFLRTYCQRLPPVKNTCESGLLLYLHPHGFILSNRIALSTEQL